MFDGPTLVVRFTRDLFVVMAGLVLFSGVTSSQPISCRAGRWIGERQRQPQNFPSRRITRNFVIGSDSILFLDDLSWSCQRKSRERERNPPSLSFDSLTFFTTIALINTLLLICDTWVDQHYQALSACEMLTLPSISHLSNFGTNPLLQRGKFAISRRWNRCFRSLSREFENPQLNAIG